MATYLAICQKAARETGLFSGTVPTTVTGQTGDLLKLVNYVADAYTALQNSRGDWQWMQGEFTAPTVSGTIRYTSTSAGWALTRWASWLHDTITPRRVFRPYSIYLAATGVSDESILRQIDWLTFTERYLRGSQTSSRPAEYAISPAGEFCLGQKPDAVYTVHGFYRKSPQTLSANTDEPEMPARFHDLIAWDAVSLFHQEDEGYAAAAAARARADEIRCDLRRDQLPLHDLGAWAPLA